MTQDSCETTPAQVLRRAGAKQAEEVRARWAWTERTVWTDRMLAALERGKAYFVEQGLLHGGSPCPAPSIRGTVNHRPESRMRENRTSGSEGGETG